MQRQASSRGLLAFGNNGQIVPGKANQINQPMTQRGPFIQGSESQAKILSIGSQMLNSARQINNLGATSINKVTISTDNFGINQA